MLPPTPVHQPDLLSDALLLAATAGLLDAVVFLNHGHVFASAMTGNAIFLGIAVLGKDWGDIIPHIVPLAAFFAGVTTSKHARTRLGNRAATVGVLFEMSALFLLALTPATFPAMAFTGIIAFVAAFQVASFRLVEGFPYSSTYITGNLRDIAEAAYEASSHISSQQTRQQSRIHARDLTLICLCFLAGAAAGAWAAPRFANRSFLFVEPLLLAVALHTFRHPHFRKSVTSPVHPD